MRSFVVNFNYLLTQSKVLLRDRCLGIRVWRHGSLSLLRISRFGMNLISTGFISSIYAPQSPYEYVGLGLVGVSHSQ